MLSGFFIKKKIHKIENKLIQMDFCRDGPGES